jgi:hypothetical protein
MQPSFPFTTGNQRMQFHIPVSGLQTNLPQTFMRELYRAQ